ncbi:MAG: glycosyltransferase [Patescibacteria group bacterium]
MKNIAIVAHKYLHHPDDDLVHFLEKRKGYNIFHVKHSFPDAKDRKSVLDIYLKGKRKKEISTKDYIFLPEPLVYFKEMFFTFKWLIATKSKYDLYIGVDGLCTFWGLLLKSLGVCKKVIYWSIDFVPLSRFKSGWKNFIYHKINSLSYKHADEVWDLSPRMLKGRKKYLGINKSDYKFHRVVPYGLWINRIKKIPYGKCEKKTLVFMGHLMKKQGVDLVIKNIDKIVKRIPGFKFKIIGDGNYRNDLVELSRMLSVDTYCQFLGRIDNIKLEKEVAKSAVAVAPYIKMKDSYTYYADPGKVKTYLACGIPLLLTDLPWNAKEIEKRKCGFIIKDDGSDLVKKLVEVMKPSVNRKFRENATAYSKDYDYEKIFSKLEL